VPITKKTLVAMLKETNRLLDGCHRGSMSPSKDCPVCDHVRATRKLIREIEK
jgi:hypothetical protein